MNPQTLEAATWEKLPEGTLAGDPRQSLRARAEAPTFAAPEPTGRRSPSQDPPVEVESLPSIAVREPGSGEGELEVIRTLGTGGMGVVVLAEQRSLRRSVALKRAHQERSPELLHEGVVTGMLEHPNIPPIHSLSRDADGRVVLVMKNIEGETWTDVLHDPSHPLRSESPLFAARDDLASQLEIVVQLCNALELAHSKGVTHRDIKPDNVMLGRFGEVYLIDWGIAHHAEWDRGRAGRIVGTPHYMAPEMAAGRPPDARTDVYLLGATLVEVLTGAPPHQADNVRAALLHAMQGLPPELGPEVPAELAALVVRALAKDPEDRFPTVRALRIALRAFLSHSTSIVLCDEALQGVEALRELLDEDAPDPVRVAALQIECRFGLQSALREWPENPTARAGRSALAATLVEHELRHQNARGARAHYAEVEAGDPELEARIDELEQTQRERAKREREEAEAAQQMDLRNARRERTAAYVFSVTVVAGLGIWRALSPVSDLDLARRHQGLLTLWLVLCSLGIGTLALVRRRLLAAEVNRRLAWLTVVSYFGVALNRITGVVLLPPPTVTLAADCAIFATTLLVGAIAVRRSIAWGAIPFVIGSIGLWAWPEHESLIFNVSSLVALLTVMVGLRVGAAPTHAGGSEGPPAAAATPPTE